MHRMRVPNYLFRMVKSYFENRVLVYSTEEGDKEYGRPVISFEAVCVITGMKPINLVLAEDSNRYLTKRGSVQVDINPFAGNYHSSGSKIFRFFFQSL